VGPACRQAGRDLTLRSQKGTRCASVVAEQFWKLGDKIGRTALLLGHRPSKFEILNPKYETISNDKNSNNQNNERLEF
jgi:hypothetical protein